MAAELAMLPWQCFTLKSDQEPAIESLVDEIGRHRAAAGGGRWVEECSPVGASAANGMVERRIQSAQAQVRALKLALENRHKVELPVKHVLVPWISSSIRPSC